MIGQVGTRLRTYALPITWMVLIFIISGDIGSMSTTSSFLVPLIRTLFHEISGDALSQVLFAIRKSGHLFEYAVLAILWFKVLKVSGQGIGRYPALMALILSGAYAGLDEVHHAFVKSRTGSMWDVGIDLLGAFLGLGFWKGIQVYRLFLKS